MNNEALKFDSVNLVNSLSIQVEDLKKQLDNLKDQLSEIIAQKNKVAIVVFSGDLDRVIASMIIATGAASFGKEVSVFFTFWGINAIRTKRKLKNKKWHQVMFSLLNPKSYSALPVSKMNFFGIGAKMLKMMMKEKNVNTLEDLIKIAKDLGVKFIACEMSKDVLGIEDEELLEGVESGGVAYFLSHSLNSAMTIFI
ncbi:MAG: DsrE/DsrF/DrsH-like family protein [Candidatus Calescibacterium sp.]|nr:DsrE/DsrF/DrsH-like family protein [Candidatus Calescibacterium sp.]MCX7971990.1 DsrE/DsrF/DrsH-like family protein [bacterium]MDW8195478.1 DsrE/DsrF/DrsH-like family protein [Candidatus Calescibacterium sp.]